MMKNEKLYADYKQYGFWGFQKRVLKFFLRKIGVEIDSYYYMVNRIDEEAQKKRFEKANISDVKILNYQDFLLGDKELFTDKKLGVVKSRLEDWTFIPYGIIRNGHLIYSCWISLRDMESSASCLNGKLEEGEALLLDDYCSPVARGKGIHTAMNAYRLWQIVQRGKKRAVVIILKENKPAFKSQIKVDFKVVFVYYVAKFWGKTYTNYFKKQKSHKNYEQ